MSDAISALGKAQAQFGTRLRNVKEGQWSDSTPCAQWTVRDLVGHAISGSDMAVTVVGGATIVVGRSFEGPDDTLVSEWERATQAELAAFSEPGALDRTVTHPAVGEIPAGQFIGMRTMDALLHSWDLARAVGGDETLPADLVSQAWAALEPMAPIIGQLGVFGSGPSGEVGEDAPIQDRLLDLTGRRP